jgi:hypothetical protein
MLQPLLNAAASAECYSLCWMLQPLHLPAPLDATASAVLQVSIAPTRHAASCCAVTHSRMPFQGKTYHLPQWLLPHSHVQRYSFSRNTANAGAHAPISSAEPRCTQHRVTSCPRINKRMHQLTGAPTPDSTASARMHVCMWPMRLPTRSNFQLLCPGRAERACKYPKRTCCTCSRSKALRQQAACACRQLMAPGCCPPDASLRRQALIAAGNQCSSA